MEALADIGGLRRLCLGARVIDVVHRQVQLIIMLLDLPAIFRASVRQHAQQRHLVLLIERQHSIVEQVGRRNPRFGGVQPGESHFGVGVHEGPLVDAPDAFHVAHIERVLGSEVAGMRGFDLTAFHLFFALALQRRNLPCSPCLKVAVRARPAARISNNEGALATTQVRMENPQCVFSVADETDECTRSRAWARRLPNNPAL
jgi:hypothetical protein